MLLRASVNFATRRRKSWIIFTRMMFKIFSARRRGNGRKGRPKPGVGVPGLELIRVELFALLLVFVAAGCRTVGPPLPKVNLQAPGWTVHEGQAVWRLPRSTREIAGEVLVATRSDGSAFVQFSKAPFPLVIAQMTSNRWQIEFPPQNRRYAGRGQPPKRLVWLYLPLVLEGRPPPENWVWREDSQGWYLENAVQEESLRGYFDR
jgi:hypothetical protein